MTTITWRGRAEKVRVIGNFKGGTEGEDLEKLPDDDLWSWRDNLEPGAYKYFFEVDGEFEMDEEGENIKCHKLQVEESTEVVYMGCSHIFVHRKDLPVTRNPTDNQLCPSCSLAASFHHHLDAEIKTEVLSPLEEESNFACSGCLRTFSSENDLLDHQRTVYDCPVCQTSLLCLEDQEKHDAMHAEPDSPENSSSSFSPPPEKMWDGELEAEDDNKVIMPAMQEDTGELNFSGDVDDSFSSQESEMDQKVVETGNPEKDDEDEIDDFEDGLEEMDEEEQEGKKVLLDQFSLLLKEIKSKSKVNETTRPDFKASSCGPEVPLRKESIHPMQEKVAEILLQRIRKSQPDLLKHKFKYFDFYTIIPYFKSLGRQTVDRLKSFIESKPAFLNDIRPENLSASRVEEHVIRNAAKGKEIKLGSEAEKVEALRERVNREKDTLFLIVHDEAHFAAVPSNSNLTNRLLNSKDITSAKNVVLLQVSATPYCLLTKNSRVPKNNLVDMVLETQTTDEDSNYYGIGKFVQNSKLQEETNSKELNPGILIDDQDFEDLIKDTSDWSAYVKNLFRPEPKESVVKKAIRFYGYVLQWISAILTKTRFDIRALESSLAEFLGKCEITSKLLANISGENGKGSMVLLRFLKKENGIYFAKLMREVRDTLNLSSDFAVGLDIDDDSNSKEATELCEKSFLPRLSSWRGGGKDYRPSTYQDLADLPIILIVVEKGKMGITYPKSLRYYDLRMRYSTTTSTTRSAMEQDFGRACRYVVEGDPPLPTVLVSHAARTQLQDHERRVLRNRQRQKKATGVFKLNPDYPKVMKPAGGGRRTELEFPTSDFDLKPYRQRWEAAEKSCDFQNEETYPNRYVLFGRPQIGKTGVFLALAFLLWEATGSPASTGPNTESGATILIEDFVIDEEEEEEASENSHSSGSSSGTRGTIENMGEYPDFLKIMSQKMQKPRPSKRYGDPNNKEVRDWYLAEGMTYPHPNVLDGNSLLRRSTTKQTTTKKTFDFGEDLSASSSIRPSDCNQPKLKVVEKINQSKFSAKPIVGQNKEISSSKLDAKIRIAFSKFSIGELGTLFIRRSQDTDKKKWILLKDKSPSVNPSLELPPILIPSSGRAHCGLFDLSDAMEGADFVQIVAVREEEKDSYLKVLISATNQIDLFVMRPSANKTIGEARCALKGLGEVITRRKGWIFMQDDNISHFSGVTLINDPLPMFGREPSSERSQTDNISLIQVLRHFNCPRVAQFSIVGFSMFSSKQIHKKKSAYSRAHVFAAVLLNMSKLGKVDYNRRAWAMEDIAFNRATHDLGRDDVKKGVIVKAMRYVAYKKVMEVGGVIPMNVPAHVQELLKQNEIWSGLLTSDLGGVNDGKKKENDHSPDQDTEGTHLKKKRLQHKGRDSLDKQLLGEKISPKKSSMPLGEKTPVKKLPPPGQSSTKGSRAESTENKASQREVLRENVTQQGGKRSREEEKGERCKRPAEEDTVDSTPGKMRKMENNIVDAHHKQHNGQHPTDGRESGDRRLLSGVNGGRRLELEGDLNWGVLNLDQGVLSGSKSFDPRSREDCERDKNERNEEREERKTEREELRKEKYELRQDREELRKERKELREEREELRQEREVLRQEREELRQERKELREEREELQQEKDEVRKEKVGWRGEREEWKRRKEKNLTPSQP